MARGSVLYMTVVLLQHWKLTKRSRKRALSKSSDIGDDPQDQETPSKKPKPSKDNSVDSRCVSSSPRSAPSLTFHSDNSGSAVGSSAGTSRGKDPLAMVMSGLVYVLLSLLLFHIFH